MNKLYVIPRSYKAVWHCSRCKARHVVMTKDIELGSIVKCNTSNCTGIAVALPGKEGMQYYYK